MQAEELITFLSLLWKIARPILIDKRSQDPLEVLSIRGGASQPFRRRPQALKHLRGGGRSCLRP